MAIFLQHPLYLEPEPEYFNPQYFYSGGETKCMTHVIGLSETGYRTKWISDEVDDTKPRDDINIVQVATGGLTGTTEHRCLDYHYRDHADWLFGNLRGRGKFMNVDEIEDEFLKKGWIEGEAEATGPEGKSHVLSHVESVDNGWTATQVWGFQMIGGERKYARNIIVAKGSERVEMRLVYDWIGEEENA